MVTIPDSLRSLFSAPVEKRGDTYVIEVPVSEVERAALEAGETYRIGVFDGLSSTARSSTPASAPQERPRRRSSRPSGGPPVDEGEVRTVTIESVGDQGDGIAKVDRGYVLIVPDASPGQEVTVEIAEVRENVAFTRVVDDDPGNV